MIGIVGGGLAAAKLVEGYREAGGGDRITIWSKDPHGPYHRPPLSKRLLRGESQPEDALVHPEAWYAENGVELRTGDELASLDDVQAETVVIATGARPRPLGDALALRTLDDSLELTAMAVELLSSTGLHREAAQAEGRAALTLQELGRVDEAAERMARAYEMVDDGTNDEAMADLAQGRAVTVERRG